MGSNRSAQITQEIITEAVRTPDVLVLGLLFSTNTLSEMLAYQMPV